ncbi:bud neck involved protein [Taxawa tesnikishii (nom. ined.)]|nr:bud neck involved protein [Dothideales sp. JES 119]
MEAEQDEIARKQEAAGIGAGIYSGQGGFTGSTDNLSISSTASSASMMLRKMGKGMKKSGRSLKGLFRPKSVTGVPAADGPVQPSLAQVSMVTVEAERQKVNVNIHPGEQVGGGTGFPKLERNSVDAAHVTDAIDRTDSMSRKSIVGSDKDRAEVLAAVKKGILKRSGTNSPSLSPDLRPLDGSRSASSQRTQSPSSSMPGTPKDERPSRSLTSTTGSNDYFSTRLVAKSMPNTPYGGTRNISFSPRIQFYDAWSSTDYDRRGDIATCNRLTPMLAQQIKEELNTFKMEMEVHELSKPHTHFF